MQSNRFVQSYSITCSVGDGSQGQAFLAQRQDQLFVIKAYFSSPKAQDYYSQQVKILSEINCPYVVRMVDHFAAARVFLGTKVEIRPAIVLQFAEHGELFKIVNLGKLSEDISRTLFHQLITALKHLKDIKIAHRDIKLENILLDHRFNLKLADFGFARNAEGSNQDFYLRSWRGTESYMAPEIHKQLYKGEKVDLFAAGVVLFLMYIRIPPFENTEVSNQKYNLIRDGKLTQFWALFERKSQPFSNSFKQLIEGLFMTDPEKRFTVQDVLKHEWLQGALLTNEEMEAYLKPRYEKLIHKDEETRNIRRNMREKLERMVNQNERPLEQRQRSRENRQQGGHRVEDTYNTNEEILKFHITSENLPKIEEYGLRYAKISPKMALLWLNQYLISLKLQKKNFFKDSLEEIELASYEIKYDEKGRIELLLSLDITSEKDAVVSELKLQGQLLHWQKLVSVSWKGVTGNQFWLYEFIQTLNQQFELTFL